MASSSHGVELQRGNGASPEVFTAVAELLDFDGPKVTAGQIETTHLKSPAKQYIPGLRDGGVLSGNCNFVGDDTVQQAIVSDMEDELQSNWRLVLADHATAPTKITFAANVQEFGLSGGVDQAVKIPFSLKISGAPDYNFAPSS